MRPGEECDSPPGQEFLGVVTSHGFYRESNTSSRKSRGWPSEAIAPTAADPPLPTERMRAAFSSSASAPTVLQRGVPGCGAAMVTVEGPGEIPDHPGRQAETERAKPALP